MLPSKIGAVVLYFSSLLLVLQGQGDTLLLLLFAWLSGFNASLTATLNAKDRSLCVCVCVCVPILALASCFSLLCFCQSLRTQGSAEY